MVVLLAAAGCTSATATPEPSPAVVTAEANPQPTAADTAPALPETATTVPTSPPADVGPALRLNTVADTVERVRPAVVSIVVEIVTRDLMGFRRSGFGSGTGVIVDPQGLVLTNNHVVEGAVGITVTMDDGSQVEAEIVGADRLSDLAVLRIPGDNHAFLPVKPDTGLRAGEWVIAIGNALALPGGPTVTLGVVSALGRSIESGPGVTLYDMIQTDTAINPGNSGGPLISLNGQLVGINTAVRRGTGGGTPVEGIGFAIDMDTAEQVSRQLIELGRVQWAFLGLDLADLIAERAAEVGLPIREGVVVSRVVIDGPSHKAGVQPGDIILSLESQPVATVRELIRMLRQDLNVGQEIEVELFREGARSTVRLTLDERPRQ